MKTYKRMFLLFPLVLALLLSGCQQPANAPEDNPLTGVVETVLAKLPEGKADDESNRAVLFDFNEDGEDELLLTYCGANRWEQRLEIWTVRDGEAVLLREETLFENAGGPAGGVRMVQKGEAPYLCVYSTNSGTRGIADNCQFMGSLDFYSPTYQTEEGLYRQCGLTYDFFGPDNRTPAPVAPEADSVLLFDGRHCDTEVFQEWMAAFDQSGPSILHVGGADGPVGMELSEILAILSQND